MGGEIRQRLEELYSGEREELELLLDLDLSCWRE
jgi:hypothetical protein